LGQNNDKARVKQYREYLNAELEAAAIYGALADTEENDDRAQVFRDLVSAEMRHARRWAEKLGIDGATLQPADPGLKVKTLQWAARRFGTSRVLPVLLRLEAKEVDAYAADPEATDLVSEERGHSRVLEKMTGPGRGVTDGGRLRAAVLGVNDGLVSNFSLVMGVAGGTASAAGGGGDPEFILLAGVAGLFAGAFSMASGEYISMRSQRDILEHEMSKEAIELQEWPEEEEEELALIYQAKGLSREEASHLAKRIMLDPKVALDTMAREELGLDPAQLGSPWGASSTSFVAFVAGAVVPIVPYIFDAGALALVLSATFSAVALAGVGGMLGAMSGRNAAWGGLRMLLAGGAAAAVTFTVGSLIGISVSAL